MNQRDTSSGGYFIRRLQSKDCGRPSDVQKGDSKDDHADDWLDQRLHHLRDSLELLYCTFGHDKRDTTGQGFVKEGELKPRRCGVYLDLLRRQSEKERSIQNRKLTNPEDTLRVIFDLTSAHYSYQQRLGVSV
jgi:hypothetical protein